MRVLIQRVKSAKVTVNKEVISEISAGLLIFLGIGKEDGEADITRLSKKVINMRIFDDARGKMNLDLKEKGGQILSVPQFTLYADTRKGNRPGFNLSADPKIAKEYWMKFNNLIENEGVSIREGVFGAHMEVELINDGPVTIWLDSKN